MPEREIRLLVKGRLPQRASIALEGGTVRFTAVPLLPKIASRRRTSAAPVSQWYFTAAQSGTASPWDVCHALVANGLGARAVVEYAEPDLEQQWAYQTPPRQALGLTSTCDNPEPQDGDVYAIGPTNTWFRDGAFSQLDAAQKSVSVDGSPVRIAHLDTGFDPGHRSRPAHLRLDLAQNFVDEDRPGDATEIRGGFVANHGHGTGTIGILAGTLPDGSPLGAAADLEIVPIRVANSVVLFRNSAIARAFDYVYGLAKTPATRVHVVTMSMGGLASAAWADAVNALYDQGIFVVAAAGNNFGNLPTRYTVYPARFNRVVAACGVMADGRPYADLPMRKMAGCYGPARKAPTSLAAFTPNIPWARINCGTTVDWDGGGTSAATPQIAAAAALWIQNYSRQLANYAQPWMRVEAVRKALFESARGVDPKRAERLGRGILRARDMLDQRPARASQLVKQPKDSAFLGLLRVLTGVGIAAGATPREQMLELEALQIAQRSIAIESILDGRELGDPELRSSGALRTVVEAIVDAPGASVALKDALGVGLKSSAGPSARRSAPKATKIELPSVSKALNPTPPDPAVRSLRIYAFDPLMSSRLDTVHLNEAVVAVPWEADLSSGPTGEYVEVVDVDPPSGSAYAPVDLNHPSILAQQGLTPSEGNPQFHQQMVYAIAMKTIAHFERALGRVALWSPRLAVIDGRRDSRFVSRLRIYPHALREANAFYSPERIALLFGYFNASHSDVGDNLPGGLVFTCLSHDIVAHETTHALLDGLHPRYKDPTSVDMLAFHEAFADIVALFQHFSMPEAVRDAIAQSRGDVALSPLLAGLAVQYGQAIGSRGALRNAIAELNDKGEWVRKAPHRTDYSTSIEQHERGSVLVAAVFDAFLEIYKRKTEDLIRLASNGTGVLPPGRIPHDLVGRLAEEAASVANDVLMICIRALDYCPPVDLTFGEYLRALVTLDRDLIPNDAVGYRAAFINAFRSRGIFPIDMTNLSVETLAWQKPDFVVDGLADALRRMSSTWDLKSNRLEAFLSSNANAKTLHDRLVGGKTDDQAFAALGLVKARRQRVINIDGVDGRVSPIEVHSVRPARRIGPNQEVLDDVVIEMTQKWTPNGTGRDGGVRGGCTLVCDRRSGELRYIIRKRVGQPNRVAAQQAFGEGFMLGTRERNYFLRRATSEPFAMMHRD